MSKLKIPLLFTSIGFIFSMVIGFLNSVNFFTILLRGFITGITVGMFVFGTLLLLKKMLPELFEKKSTTEPTSSGLNVNITLDETLEQSAAEGIAESSKGTDVDNTVSVDEIKSSTDVIEDSVTDEVTGKEENVTINDNKTILAGTDENITDEIGELPSIEAFDVADASEEDTSEPVTANISGISMSDVQIPSADTKIMAEAIRTVLKSSE